MKELSIEEKSLLLKDLYARLPYGFFVHRYSDNADIRIDNIGTFCQFLEYSEGEDFKPYLRSLSSMTEEEKTELFQLMGNGTDIQRIDFYLSHYFDFRCLIPMGLALEAKEGMYETEEQKN